MKFTGGIWEFSFWLPEFIHKKAQKIHLPRGQVDFPLRRGERRQLCKGELFCFFRPSVKL